MRMLHYYQVILKVGGVFPDLRGPIIGRKVSQGIFVISPVSNIESRMIGSSNIVVQPPRVRPEEMKRP